MKVALARLSICALHNTKAPIFINVLIKLRILQSLNVIN